MVLYFVTLQICWQNIITSKIIKGTTMSFFGLWIFFRVWGIFFNCIQLVSLYSSLKKNILSRKFQTLPSYSVGKDSEIKSKEHIKSENICIVSCLHCFIFIKPSKACFLSLLLWFVKQSYVCLFPPPPNT